MIAASGRFRVFAYAAVADMRKSYEGLSALVRQELGRDPLSGDLYLFCNRVRHRAKVLHWDGTGLCIYMKRLEKGRVASVPRRLLARRSRNVVACSIERERSLRRSCAVIEYAHARR